MKNSKVLLVDALINFLLGVILLSFHSGLVNFLGIPGSQSAFYPNILGAVFIGITLALLIEYFRKPSGIVGLGLGGAVSINLCGGLVLTVWLLAGNLSLPFRGYLILWILVLGLVVISSVELAVHLKFSRRDKLKGVKGC